MKRDISSRRICGQWADGTGRG